MAIRGDFPVAKKAHTVDLPSASREAKTEVILSLTRDLFARLGERLTHVGFSLAEAHQIADLQTILPKPATTPHPSIFADRLFPSMTDPEKRHFLSIVQEYNCNFDTSLFHVMGVRLINNWRGLEKELGRAHCPGKDMFFSNYWKFICYLMINAEAEDLYRDRPLAVTRFIEGGAFLSTADYGSELLKVHTQLTKIRKPSAAKERTILDLEIFMKFLGSAECALKFGYLARLETYQECQGRPTHVKEYLPFIQYAHFISRILDKNGLICRSCDSLLTRSFESMEKELTHLKESKSGVQTKQLDRIYKIYIDVILKTGDLFHKSNQKAIGYFIDPSRAILEEASQNFYDFFSLGSALYWLHPIAVTLELQHDIRITSLINRIKTLSLFLSSQKPEQASLAPSLARLAPLRDQCDSVKFLRLDKDSLKRVNTQFLRMLDLERDLEPVYRILRSGEEREAMSSVLSETPTDREGRKKIVQSSISMQIDLISKIESTFVYESFEGDLTRIYAETKTLLEALPAEMLTEEFQEGVRELFFEALEDVCYEFLLYQDVRKLLFNEEISFEKLMPQALLDLLCFELPGKPNIDSEVEQTALEELDVAVEALRLTPSVLMEEKKAEQKPAKAAKASKQEKKAEAPKQPHELATAFEEEIKQSKKFRQIINVLKRMNLKIVRQRGSHVVLQGAHGIVVVPHHAELREGTVRSIASQALRASGHVGDPS